MQAKKILIVLFLLLPPLITQGCSKARTSEASSKIPEKAYFVIEGIAPFKDEEIAMAEFNETPTEISRKKLAMIREAYALNYAISGEKESDPEALEFALLYAESAAELDPENANYWILAGELLMKFKGNIVAIAEANECFEKAVDLDPTSTTALLLLGQTQFAVGMYREALDNFEDALERDIDIADTKLISVMTFSYIRGKEDERGIRFFADLLEKDPAIDSARLSLGVLLYNRGNTAQAAEEIKKVKMREGASDDNRSYSDEILEIWGYKD